MSLLPDYDDAIGRGRFAGIGRPKRRKALEAKIDNRITAITRDLFVFIRKCYRRVRLVSTTRPEGFPTPPRVGSRLSLQREVVRETELRFVTAASSVPRRKRIPDRNRK